MRISSAVLVLVHFLAVSGLASGTPVDRRESDRQQHTAVINFLATTKDRRAEEVSRSAAAATATYGGEEEEGEYDYYEEEDYEDGDGLSGDYQPRVAMSSKPKDPTVVQERVAESAGEKQPRGKGRKRGKGKGKGRKRNPCLKKYKDFCIHGTCHYLRDISTASCVCLPNYSGERCEFFTLPVQSPEGYSRTTALAVVAVVLSSVCLVIIGLLLMLRFHKRGAYDVESEEKVKLGSASSH
ncbi:proheparin-binding EGF-like growth factor [Betta splendens]|uniref:Proheparin-binding EGF-like growth factor n=1 Tax=Betta splendens TaxID=158456 RepID=A0A6P7NUE4_BETSP|nr:proheparin-binding EGF-like growth factor [Betta splendens]